MRGFAKKDDDFEIKYYNTAGLATILMAFFDCILLVTPISICYVLITRVGSNKAYAGCIAVLVAFTLIFCLCMIAFTNARRHEILAGVAALVSVSILIPPND